MRLTLLRLLHDGYSELALDLIANACAAWVVTARPDALQFRRTTTLLYSLQSEVYASDCPPIFLSCWQARALRALRPGALLHITEEGLWLPEAYIHFGGEVVLPIELPQLGEQLGTATVRFVPKSKAPLTFRARDGRLWVGDRRVGRANGRFAITLDVPEQETLRAHKVLGPFIVHERGLRWNNCEWRPECFHVTKEEP